MTGIERRAERALIDCRMAEIDEFDYAICAVGGRAKAHPGSAEVLFHCAHGYGEFYVPEELWRFGFSKRRVGGLVKRIRAEVAAHHARLGIDTSDRREFWKVVAL